MRFSLVLRKATVERNTNKIVSLPKNLIVPSAFNSSVYLPLTNGTFKAKFEEFINVLKSHGDLTGRPADQIFPTNRFLGFNFGNVQLSEFPHSWSTHGASTEFVRKVLDGAARSIRYKTGQPTFTFKMGGLMSAHGNTNFVIFPTVGPNPEMSSTLRLISRTVFVHLAKAGLLARPQMTPANPALRLFKMVPSPALNLEALYALPEFAAFIQPGFKVTDSRGVVPLDLGEVEVSELALVPYGLSPMLHSWKNIDLSSPNKISSDQGESEAEGEGQAEGEGKKTE